MIHLTMIPLNRWASTDGVRLMATLCVLGLFTLMGCGDSEDEAAPTPTPQSALFATPPAGTSTGAEDESDIVVELDQTATPYPTSTPYPTATPYPAATPYPVAVSSSEDTSGPGPFTPGSPRTPESTTAAPQAGPTIRISIPKKSEVKLPKADSTLNNLVDRVESGEITAEEAAEEAPLHRGESVGVIIILSGNVEGVAAFLKANRASNINAGDDYIEAFVPILLLGQTSEQPGVLRVNQIQPPGETQGTPQVTGQGPGVHGSGPWNDAGYAGQGVKVGVIDRGFSGYAEIMGSEVPATVEARCYIWLGQHSQDPADCSDAGTHGTIVSESVMDIAPEAALYISDPQSLSELRDAVDWMISEGVSVINHSRLWSFDGPGDGTSPLSISPLNSIDRAVAAGIVWVNAAGNQALGTWFKRGPFDYTTVNIDGEGIRFLRFTGSEIRNKEAYIGGRLELRWEDDWGGAETDLDLFALVTGTDTIALQSIDIQSGGAGHNPYEWIGSLSTYDIVVAHRGGPEPDWVQLVGWGPTRLTLNSSGAGSITNPAESANPAMLAVGAAPWYNVNVLSGFSSRGPTPDGRIKPDVVAANCGPTATGGEGFCGTSQSSPHVAGMAALVWQRYPDYTPAQVASYLKENAEQRTSPDPNSNWGHGFFVLPPLTQPPPSPTAPGAPGILSLTPGTNSLTVSWRAPLQTGGATITSYDLRHIRSDAPNKADGNWRVVRRVWTGTGGLTHALHSLTGSVPYDVQVRAVNSAGDGPWSLTRTGTPVSPLVVPGSPIFVSASPGAGSLSVSWSAPPDDGGSTVTSYDLRHIRSDAPSKSDSNWTLSRRVSTGFGALRYLLTGLAVGTRYDVQVRAVNAVGEGTWSATATGTPLVQPVCQDSNVVPNASTNPQLVSDCETLLALKDTLRGTGTLNWSSSVPIRSWTGVRVGGSPLRVSEFRIQGNMTGRIPSELGNLNGLTLLDLSNNQLTGTIPRALGNLPNLRFLYLQSNRLTGDIPAELGNLSSLEVLYLWSNQLAGTIPPQLSRANSLEELSFSDNRIVGSLPSELGSLTTLTSLALARNELSGSIPAELANLGNLQTLKLSGNQLTGCIPATLRDVPDNDLTGLGLPDCGAATAPGAPTGLAASANGQTQISLSWRAPANDGGGAITGYRIEVSEDRQRWTDQVSNTGSITTIYAHTGLMPGDTRHYRISALNSAGAGQPSAIATESTAAANVPGAPSVASVTAGKGSLTVTWGAPVQTGGTPVTAYDLRHIRSDAPNRADASWTVVQDVWTGSGALSRELSGLDGGVQLDVQVRAVNSAGDGQWSTTATGTPEATVDIPAPPANAQYQHEGSTAVVTWDPSAGATSYKVYYDDFFDSNCRLGPGVPRFCEELAGDVIGTSYTHTDPDDDRNYYWVTACNSGGCSEIDSANPARMEGQGPAPDLVVDAPTVSDNSPAAGVSFTLSATARNQGNGRSNSTTLRYYQSTDSTITSGDTEVGTDRILGLNASASEDESISLTAPSTSGTHYYGACVDSVTDESDTQNNCSSAVTVTVSSTAGVPDAPTGLMATADGETDIDLSWTAPSDDGGANITGYRIEVSTNGSNWSDLEANTNLTATSYSHSGLTASTTMHYRVSAINSTGTGPASNVANATTGSAATPDLVVDRPTASESAPYAGERFTLSATVRNQGNGDAGASTLRYYQSTDSTITTSDTGVDTDSVSPLDASETGDESTTLTAPSTAGTYYYGACVDALSDESDTTNNCSVAIAVTVGAIGSPDLVVENSNLRANLTPDYHWSPNATVRNQGDAPSASTTLRYLLSTDSTISTADTEVGTKTVPRLNPSDSIRDAIGLNVPSEPGTYYYGACVDTVPDESVTTNNCSTATEVTVRVVNQPPQVVGDIDDISVAVGESFRVDISVVFSEPDGEEVGNYGFSVAPRQIITGTVNTQSGILNLRAIGVGVATVSVDARDVHGNGSGSHELFKVTVVEAATADKPGAPPGLAATADGQTEIDLSWSAPTDDGGANITGYKIEVSTNGTSWTDLVANTGTTVITYPHSGLTAGSTRYYRVSAINSEGTGTASNTDSATTAAAVKPGVPTGLSATANGQTEIDLSWSAPSDDGGADITGYKIEVSTNGTSWTDLVANTGTTVITYSHSGLAAGSTRYYRVSAINSEGTGTASNTDSATTAAAVKPGVPTGLSATADGQTEIDLSWSAPTDDGGANITGYKIEVSTDGSSWSNLVADTGSTSTSYSHTGLAAGSTRHYRVSAINSAGTGTASNTDSATTESDTQTQTDGECVADLRVQLGDNCTYPGTTEEFSVDASGNGQFLFFSSGSKLEIRNSNINGFIYTLVASKQGDGSWLVEEVG